jgi:hypothetical protein
MYTLDKRATMSQLPLLAWYWLSLLALKLYAIMMSIGYASTASKLHVSIILLVDKSTQHKCTEIGIAEQHSSQ